MWRAGPRAERELDAVLDALRADGFHVERAAGGARIERDDGVPLRIDVVRQGKIFGGSYSLEFSTADPVLPATRGLRARPRGLVKLGGVDFRPRGGDDEGRMLAARLERDEALQAAIGKVHFERIRVEPDGRPVIRHLGGSVVWILFPPLVRPIPFVPDQRRATVAALDAFGAVRSGS